MTMLLFARLFVASVTSLVVWVLYVNAVKPQAAGFVLLLTLFLAAQLAILCLMGWRRLQHVLGPRTIQAVSRIAFYFAWDLPAVPALAKAGSVVLWLLLPLALAAVPAFLAQPSPTLEMAVRVAIGLQALLAVLYLADSVLSVVYLSASYMFSRKGLRPVPGTEYAFEPAEVKKSHEP
jgi:hypothetical protein